MRAQIKVVLLVAVILVVTFAALMWKTEGVLRDDQLSFVSDSAMKQLAPLKRLVVEKLDSAKNDLVRFATSRESAGPGHATAFSGFDAIALVEPSSTAPWVPTWIEKGSNLRAERWPEGYDLTLLKSLPYARVKEGSTLWVRLSDAQGAPLYAVMDSVEIQSAAAVPVPVAGALPSGVAPTAPVNGTRRAIIVGFASENPLASVTEDYIGSTNLVYLVDDRGYVASHVKNPYLGNSFSEDKITQEITKSPKLSDTKETTDMDGQKVLAHFEKIDRTNLAAVIETPMAATMRASTTFTNALMWVGGIVGLLALVAAFLVGGTLEKSAPMSPFRRPVPDDAFPSSEELAAAAPTVSSVETCNLPQEVSREDLAKEAAAQNDRLRDERKNAFEAFNAGLAARLREPLLAILGHAQLAKSKAGMDEDLKAHTDSIEREARLAKDAIDRFQVIEESASLGQVTESSDLEKVVLSALAEKAIEIEGSGIQLEQNLKHVPHVRGRAQDLEAMIVHVLENSVEAMRDRQTKKMTVALSWLNDTVRLLISDSGIGMTRDVQARAFEPFFKGFAAPRHMGLGLAFVHTTLKRIGAEAELESSPGEGTVFTMEFPVEPAARKDFEASTAAPDLQQIQSSIDSFTLGGLKPLRGPLNAPKPPPTPVADADETAVETKDEDRVTTIGMRVTSTPPPKLPLEMPAMIEDEPGEEPDDEPGDEFGEINEFTITSLTDPGLKKPSTDSETSPTDDEADSFRVKIRRPKPRT